MSPTFGLLGCITKRGSTAAGVPAETIAPAIRLHEAEIARLDVPLRAASGTAKDREAPRRADAARRAAEGGRACSCGGSSGRSRCGTQPIRARPGSSGRRRSPPTCWTGSSNLERPQFARVRTSSTDGCGRLRDFGGRREAGRGQPLSARCRPGGCRRHAQGTRRKNPSGPPRRCWCATALAAGRFIDSLLCDISLGYSRQSCCCSVLRCSRAWLSTRRASILSSLTSDLTGRVAGGGGASMR